jgi:hypothetical protein
MSAQGDGQGTLEWWPSGGGGGSGGGNGGGNGGNGGDGGHGGNGGSWGWKDAGWDFEPNRDAAAADEGWGGSAAAADETAGAASNQDGENQQEANVAWADEGWGGSAAAADETAGAASSQDGKNQKEANVAWEGRRCKKWPVQLSQDVVDREYTWFVDFRESGKNLWLEFSEEHVAILERALALSQEICELEHKYVSRNGQQKTTTYTISLEKKIQTSGDNGSERRIRRFRAANYELLDMD